MNYLLRHNKPYCVPTFIHHVVCRHRVEVEVWPAQAEVYFQDERYVNPVNTKIQFDVVVYNAPTDRVTWQVADPNGSPGVGTIDASGLYIAPLKGTLPYGLTEIIIATAADDPFRKAYARVTLLGLGPEPKPEPRIEIFPKRACLYYPEGHHNYHIDISNTRQFFRGIVYGGDSNELEWFKDGTSVSPWWHDNWYLYEQSGSGSLKDVKITARLKGNPNIKDEAVVTVHNYSWPGIVV
ncbi:MAG: hypothetical protein C4B58_06665 [Deltaproteobacteria bacterium]|nr:MAG: hypothetical protein C4B58_06665 [Deltaproteobacteria bacterium]